MSEFFCKNCGTVAKPKREIRGSRLLLATLLITQIFMPPSFGQQFIFCSSIWYVIWCYLPGEEVRCSACNSLDVIPADSPVAQKLLGGNDDSETTD